MSMVEFFILFLYNCITFLASSLTLTVQKDFAKFNSGETELLSKGSVLQRVILENMNKDIRRMTDCFCSLILKPKTFQICAVFISFVEVCSCHFKLCRLEHSVYQGLKTQTKSSRAIYHLSFQASSLQLCSNIFPLW